MTEIGLELQWFISPSFGQERRRLQSAVSQISIGARSPYPVPPAIIAAILKYAPDYDREPERFFRERRFMTVRAATSFARLP